MFTEQLSKQRYRLNGLAPKGLPPLRASLWCGGSSTMVADLASRHGGPREHVRLGETTSFRGIASTEMIHSNLLQHSIKFSARITLKVLLPVPRCGCRIRKTEDQATERCLEQVALSQASTSTNFIELRGQRSAPFDQFSSIFSKFI
jgi:hypothetical protein